MGLTEPTEKRRGMIMKPAGENYGPSKSFMGRGTITETPPTQAVPDAPEIPAGQPGDDRRYKSAKVMSASPLELILIMYEQFFELIPDIKANMERGSAAATEPDSERAQAIVDELISSLDFNIEISRDLGAIYFYVRNRIMEANVKFDPAIWDNIEATMRPLYNGFKDAAGQLETPRGDPMVSASAQIVAGMTYGRKSLKEIVVNTKSGLQA